MSINIEVKQLPQPLLEFGGPGLFLDQKEGLSQAGPFDLRFGGAHRNQVRVGVVGPTEMVDKAVEWIERCKKPILSDMSNLNQYPPFLGFEEVFKARLDLSPKWIVEFKDEDQEIEKILQLKPRERFEQAVDLYSAAVSRIASQEVKPDIVFCCIPESVVRVCWSISRDLSNSEWKTIQKRKNDQRAGQMLLPGMDDFEETTEDLLYRDFRRALKAQAMKAKMPIQIAREALLVDSEKTQDAASRAWNMSVALYYKAGGIPWRISTKGPETCFVGISFHHLRTNKRHLIRSSIAQAFSTEGDGFALRGDEVPFDPKQGYEVHLTEEQAARLATKVLDRYKNLSGGEPLRVVFHKTSKFNDAEREGFRAALRNVPIVELINLSPSMFRLVQFGQYPPRRGTLCRVNDQSVYLFTSGFMPEWGTYPGPHIPSPLRLVTNDDIDVERAAADVLGLTRMNWNTAQNTNSQPVTIRFARQVGGIMAEVEDGEEEASYRYYM